MTYIRSFCGLLNSATTVGRHYSESGNRRYIVEQRVTAYQAMYEAQPPLFDEAATL